MQKNVQNVPVLHLFQQRNVNFLNVAAVVCCCVTQLLLNLKLFHTDKRWRNSRSELRIYFPLISPLTFPLIEQEASTSSKFKY